MEEERAYQFDLTIQPKPIIKVIGVGGGGSNAVNFMFNQGFRDVEFVVCNTDSQALRSSPIQNKIQLGGTFLGGLGAGAIPENGREAANISEEAIREMLSDGTKMAFITAGMGGGTGTGAAPVIAKIAKELGILTIGIVTRPFRFEGPRKNQAAETGVTEMRKYCDTVIEILNDKIRELFGSLAMNQAFSQADHVLSTSAKSLSEIITVPGIINVDFKDIETTMKNSGTAVMGSATAKGDHRAMKAIQEAISSPLLNNNEIEGATKVLLAITYGHAPELTMDEFYEITDFLEQRTGSNAEVIFGTSMDPELGDTIRVTVIATGFEKDALVAKQAVPEKLPVRREGPEDTYLGESAPKTVYQQPQYMPAAPVNIPATVPVTEPQRTWANEKTPVFQQNEPQRPVSPAPVPSQQPLEPQKEYLSLEGEYLMVHQSPPNVERPLEDVVRASTQNYNQTPDRATQLRNISQNQGIAARPNYEDPDFIRHNEEPAYLRKQQVNVAPSQSAMSRFTVNENNEILNNNRFLHDNVD